ncbi:hypothetical protein VWH05_05765 [Escherichia coli O157]|nr:hypothetical protein [Escherichia coli O157]
MNTYELDCFTLQVMSVCSKKDWSSKEFKAVIACSKKGKSIIETAAIVDSL